MITFLLAFALWSLVHTLTATVGFKNWVRSLVGDQAFDGLYRLVYNLLAAVTFLPVLALGAAQIPVRQLWVIPWPWVLLSGLVQAVGAVGLLISLLQTDLLRFLGLGQALRYVRGATEVNPPPRLVTHGVYALVRHPLYFFSLLFLWFSPVMLLSTLLFNIAATLYFWLGSIYEERKLATVFGEEYRVYAAKVPRLLPRWGRGG